MPPMQERVLVGLSIPAGLPVLLPRMKGPGVHRTKGPGVHRMKGPGVIGRRVLVFVSKVLGDHRTCHMIHDSVTWMPF